MSEARGQDRRTLTVGKVGADDVSDRARVVVVLEKPPVLKHEHSDLLVRRYCAPVDVHTDPCENATLLCAQNGENALVSEVPRTSERKTANRFDLTMEMPEHAYLRRQELHSSCAPSRPSSRRSLSIWSRSFATLFAIYVRKS